MHGIAGDIAFGLTLAILAVYYGAMIWCGLKIAGPDPPPARYEARHRKTGDARPAGDG